MTRAPRPRSGDTGSVLVNVLVVLALTSAVVVAMLDLSDVAIRRSQGFSDAAAARAILDGAEASAIAVLRRDLREAPTEDHLGEPWARASQDDIAIDGGRLRVAIEDAQSRFNLNSLVAGGVAAEQVLARLIAQADLPADTLVRIRNAIAREPLNQLGDLGPAAGLSDDTVARLAPVVTALPGAAPVNVNTMPEALFIALAADAAQARLIQGLRERQGSLTSGDLLALGIVLPPVAGFRSDHFTVRAQATVGAVTVARETRLERIATDGRPASVTIRTRTTVAPGPDR